ncbi:MAG: 50S ribosomal protein L11 methyltransferase [Alphaproteobacteria bacterium]|nr:50S ribosomal protein L11 methyltransferase [Alphaproteobacteria bacterium]
MTKAEKNPFAQSPEYWNVNFTITTEAVATAENAFDDIALSVSSFETDEDNGVWTFDVLFSAPPDMADIERRLMLLSALHGVALPKATLAKVVQEDWLAKVARDFPPISIGRFYVHGRHVTEPAPAGAMAIQVEAGAAFGSGEHGTTSCCLEAIDWLAKKRKFKNILDMGCGSGILAIAAAKVWNGNVLAVDIDDVAVRVTEENIGINQVKVDAAVSDGYNSDKVRRGAPYDLIVANILARPLIEFAPHLAANLAPDGVAVLSGLLATQEKQVLSAHMMQGLKLNKRFLGGEWCTLVLTR